jgi:hypothetical protein
MVRHIVMWRFKDSAEGRTKQENMQYIKERLYQLKDLIPEINSMEVGVNVNKSDAAYDMVLVSVFEDIEALERYEVHPEHRKVSEYVKKVRNERAVTDYIF